MIDSSVDYKNLPRPTWAEIDIDAILNNINEYKKALGKISSMPLFRRDLSKCPREFKSPFL